MAPRLTPLPPLVRLVPDAPSYPARVRALRTPPKELWHRGPLHEAPFSVAIVGTREPDEHATLFAWKLAEEVCARGGCVVSGGAFGIDTAAHEGALRVGGRTIAVLGTGHLHTCPPEQGPLYDRIARDGGTLVWCLPPGTGPNHWTFPNRNRILVALSDAVVVVQAPEESGALGAAKHARRLGRTVWAVPTAPWEEDTMLAGFAGSHELMRAGHARPLWRTKDLFESLDRDAPTQLALPLEAPDDLTHEEKSVFASLDATPRHVDDLGLRAGLSPQALATALLTLTLENVVVEGPGGFFRRA